MAIAVTPTFYDIPVGALVRIELKDFHYMVPYEGKEGGNFRLGEVQSDDVKIKAIDRIVGQYYGRTTPSDSEDCVLISPFMSENMLVRVPADAIKKYRRVGAVEDLEFKTKSA